MYCTYVHPLIRIRGMARTKQERGKALAQSCEIKQVSENSWIVPSQSGNGSYKVTKLGDNTYAMLALVKTLNIVMTDNERIYVTLSS
jgi:hypothetical protein